jgi:hypothetical protein
MDGHVHGAAAACVDTAAASDVPSVAAATATAIAGWQPREALATPETFHGTVVDTRHRGRFVFFATLRREDGESTELIFRGKCTAGGMMPDDDLRWLKQRLRPGDMLRATVSAIERSTREGVPPLMHVSEARVLALSLRSNTGREHMRVLDDAEQQPPVRAGMGGGPSDTRRRGRGDSGKTQDGEGDEGDEGGEGDEGHEDAEGFEGEAGGEGGEGEAGGEGGGEARRQERAKLFVDWLLVTFGAALRTGESGGGAVLDVAGGRGEVCFHLSLAGVRCTLVDPRPSSGYLAKWQRKRLRKSGQPSFGVAHEFFGEAGGEASAALARDAALIVGMHPDEVTEVIVDAALAARTPFAVVPCCVDALTRSSPRRTGALLALICTCARARVRQVFSRIFPHRRLPGSDAPVRTHEQLCAYLRSKDPSIRLGKLPFAGKSTVVYSLGPSSDAHGDAGACEPCEP